MKDAECAKPEVNPEWFFPGRGKSNDIAMAMFTCFVCPLWVQAKCRDYRLKTDSVGIWASDHISEG